MRFATICTAVILLSGCASFGPKTQEYNDKFPYVEIPTPEEYRSDNYPKPVVFAKYPGGKERLTNYIRMNTRYPVEAYRDGVYVDVTITYVVGTDGSTKDIEAVESPSEDFTEMFTIIIQKMDRWEAALLNGEPVEQKYAIKTQFNEVKSIPAN